MIGLIKLSDAIKNILEKIAFTTGWLLIVLMFITCFDIFGRKLGIPIPLTKFQELEWYMHTAVFSAWMGYNYAINAHPGVDSYTESLSFKTRAWIELVGIIIFSFPYMALMVYYGWDFFITSFLQNERSENSVGLEWRWIMKGVFYIGLRLVALGIFSVFLRLVAYLFGGMSQKDTGLDLGHVELEA